MTPSDLQTALTEISKAFPGIRRWLTESPRVLEEWQKALRPQSATLVDHAISRWIHQHKSDPTLTLFLDCLDQVATEQTQRQAKQRQPSTPTEAGNMLGDMLAQAAGGAETPEDRAWGRLHVEMFLKGIAVPGEDNALQRVELYRAFAEAHPALRGLAMEAAQDAAQDAGRPGRTQDRPSVQSSSSTTVPNNQAGV